MNLTVTGTLAPDATGTYTESGTYNGKAAYTNSTYWLWYSTAGGGGPTIYQYNLSLVKGTGTNAWYINTTIDASPVGTYTASGSYTGAPIVAIQTHLITLAYDTGIVVTPASSPTVNDESSQAFTISVDDAHILSDVVVDGVSVGAVATYTFSTVRADHTIAIYATSSSFSSAFLNADFDVMRSDWGSTVTVQGNAPCRGIVQDLTDNDMLMMSGVEESASVEIIVKASDVATVVPEPNKTVIANGHTYRIISVISVTGDTLLRLQCEDLMK